ncbi:MAG: hypothetical protein L6R40_001861 [Gallowayella cf. fulva]|nr:MAG: hypothetical protein L6R40_001861 [Xanthomendoza cf. fulva]
MFLVYFDPLQFPVSYENDLNQSERRITGILSGRAPYRLQEPQCTRAAKIDDMANVTTHLRNSLTSQGFVIIPSVLKPTQISSLRSACATARSHAESGHWPHLRTLPKQFPPWSSDPSVGIWGIQHLLHPDMPSRDLFAASYFNDTIIDTIKQRI